jgi:hypothetical protein
MTVGSGAGESRKLLRMDSSEGGMMNVDVVRSVGSYNRSENRTWTESMKASTMRSSKVKSREQSSVICSDMTVGSGAGESRKLLRMDSSEGGMMNVDVVRRAHPHIRTMYRELQQIREQDMDRVNESIDNEIKHVNFCSDMTVGSGAGESRKLLRMDSSEGGMMNVDAKVHRALPKTLESPSTHQNYVSGVTTDPRTRHGLSVAGLERAGNCLGWTPRREA